MKNVTFEPVIGSDFYDNVKDAIVIANKFDTNVEYEFNGHKVKVTTDSSFQELHAEYRTFLDPNKIHLVKGESTTIKNESNNTITIFLPKGSVIRDIIDPSN